MAGSALGAVLIIWAAPQLLSVLRGTGALLDGGTPWVWETSSPAPSGDDHGLTTPIGRLPPGTETPRPSPDPTTEGVLGGGPATPAPTAPRLQSGPTAHAPIDDPSPPPVPPPDPTVACNDGVDNDGDGYADLADPGCFGPLGTSELPVNERPSATPVPVPTGTATAPPTPSPPVTTTPTPTPVLATPTPSPQGTPALTPPPTMGISCSDGIDNDGDLLVDLLDPGCQLFGDESSA